VRLLGLTAALAVVYLGAKYLLLPPTFGQYGFYRGDALKEVASRHPVYGQEKACDECHSEVLQTLSKFEHKTVGCESCHGVSTAHAGSPDVGTPVDFKDQHCNRCHEADAVRPGWLKQITVGDHYQGQPCIECHLPHQPNEVPDEE
jgi:hypothetical protein